MEQYMATHAGESVFDPDTLNNLVEQLQSAAAAKNYALAFVGLLQNRYDRILAALGNDDIPASLDAVLSLKVNAHMVGAHAMEHTCQTLHRHIRAGDTPTAARHALLLPRQIDDAKRALTEFLTGCRC